MSHSAGLDTVQAQGWSVVEREQAFTELEAAKKGEVTHVARAGLLGMGRCEVERLHCWGETKRC